MLKDIFADFDAKKCINLFVTYHDDKKILKPFIGSCFDVTVWIILRLNRFIRMIKAVGSQAKARSAERSCLRLALLKK